jgi:hypothetical protein
MMKQAECGRRIPMAKVHPADKKVSGKNVFMRGTAIQKKGKRGWRLIDPDGKRFKAVLISKGVMDGKRIVTYWVYPQPGPEEGDTSEE